MNPAIDDFIDELKADPSTAADADALADAFAATDLEGDGNPDAICLMAAVAAVCRVRKPLIDRLRAIDELVNLRGRITVTVPREFLR